MPTGTLAPVPQQPIFKNDGTIASGAQANWYNAGTTTPATVYSDSALATALSQPVTANAGGRFPAVYLTPGSSYKVIITDSAGASIYTQDNIGATPATSSNLEITGTAGEAITAAQFVYLSDGSGSKTAGQWYRVDNANEYSSVTPEIGFAPSAIASGASGTIRLSGAVTGLSGLTVGGPVYVGAAGATTVTAPTANPRIIGQADTATSLAMTAADLWPPQPMFPLSVCEGRLTLTSVTPVTTADVTAATTIYYTPYMGNRIMLYNGTRWLMRTFSEISLAVPATTNTMYDMYAYDNAGTVTLEALAWTNDTTRATALVLQNGVLSKSGALTRRYLGSFRTRATSGQTEDSFAFRFLWNYYNRRPRLCRVQDTTATWAYTTATWREARGQTTNRVQFVLGYGEEPVKIEVAAAFDNTVAGTRAFVSIGENSTTTPVAGVMGQLGMAYIVSYIIPLFAYVEVYPAIGFNFYSWLEQSEAAGTTTFYGTLTTTPFRGSGIQAVIMG